MLSPHVNYSPVLALLAVPGLLVAGITLVVDAWGRRHRDDPVDLDLVGSFRPSGIADEAQHWLDTQW
jgi:hypothetical protein